MIYALILGVILGINGVSVWTTTGIISSAVILRAFSDILFRKTLIGGSDSPYVLYVKQLASTGDGSIPKRPWIGYLLQASIFFIPIALIAYFVSLWLAK